MNALDDRSGDAGPELHVLALNSGSSSLKFGLYRVGVAATRLVSGEAEGVGAPESTFRATDARGHALLHESVVLADQRAAIERIGALLRETRMPAPQVVGHRIVHGGPTLQDHCRIASADAPFERK